MLGCSMRTLTIFSPHDAMLTMLVCATCWLCLHLYMLAYMLMHESYLLVCYPYFETMKFWTSDPNLHLSPMDNTFCSPCRFFAFFLVCLLAYLLFCSFVCLLSCGSSCLLPNAILAMSIMFIYFMPLSYALCICSFHCLSAGFLSLSLHVHT